MPDFELDRLSATPLWEQLASQLREAIMTGEIPPDRKLPTEQALSRDHGTSRGTVARAYELLRSENLIVWTRGRGLFTTSAADIDRARQAQRETS
ncbi:MAG: GntR family transcriptional regulator [Streptosporangiaceae bacterium]